MNASEPGRPGNQHIGLMDVPLDLQKVAYWARMPLPPNKTCERAIEATRRGIGDTAYSQQDYSSYAYIWTDKGPPEEFFKREKTFFVQGCFAYQTPGDKEVYSAPYCMFLYPAKGFDPLEWQFRFCPIRAEAPAAQQSQDTMTVSPDVVPGTSIALLPLEQLRPCAPARLPRCRPALGSAWNGR